ncbi:4-(cytidine 5'-diphospho)-2-C-methyl-D-erythritol kinase [Candidatus Peregrinibacteria bacterium]|nr:4-(cytidine 5'-diphospho)-2-C-methyl-D-erythritol kinase [Candidatus Peregrinibacteria bacterium]
MEHKSYAKVNLALDILDKEDKGYHHIQTVLQRISLHDVIEITPAPRTTITFHGDEAPLINTKHNTVTQALDLLRPTKTYDIVIHKHIPLGTGLGGGSSNAATILSVLNNHESSPLPQETLVEYGAKIGVDVPFFLYGPTALGTHYGERIQPLPDYTLQPFHPLLVIPHLRANTAQHYKKIMLDKCGHKTEKTQALLHALRKNDTSINIFSLLHNDFETIKPTGFVDIKNVLQENGAQCTLLCGSGSGVLALFNNPCDEASLSQALPNQRILNLHQ